MALADVVAEDDVAAGADDAEVAAVTFSALDTVAEAVVVSADDAAEDAGLVALVGGNPLEAPLTVGIVVAADAALALAIPVAALLPHAASKGSGKRTAQARIKRRRLRTV